MAAPSPTGRRPPRAPPAPGAAYLLLLVTVATLGIAAAGSATLGAAASRQDAERQLLATGAEFTSALASYRAAAPANRPVSGPQDLAALLKDPRIAGVRRHLRQVRDDPLTGQPDWGLVRARDGGIVGVYSQAPGRPQKQQGFGPLQAHFQGAERYADWVFTATPEALAVRRAAITAEAAAGSESGASAGATSGASAPSTGPADSTPGLQAPAPRP